MPHHTFDSSNIQIKEEPIDEDYQEQPAFNNCYQQSLFNYNGNFAVHQQQTFPDDFQGGHNPQGYLQGGQTDVHLTYEQLSEKLDNEIAFKDRLIANSPDYQREFIEAEIVKETEKRMRAAPWMRRKEAQMATKFKKIQLDIRAAAEAKFVSNFYEEPRVNPGRAAKTSLDPNAYVQVDDDDDDILFLESVAAGSSDTGRSKKNKRKNKNKRK